MKTMLDKLLEREIAVSCDTKKEAESLLRFLHLNGFSWKSGASLLEETLFEVIGKGICYKCENPNPRNKDIVFGKSTTERNCIRCEVIEFKDFMRGCGAMEKETNFEHYKDEIKKITKKHADSAGACNEIVQQFELPRTGNTTLFEDVFAWGMSEYKPEPEAEEMTMEQLNAKLKELGYDKKVKIIQ